MAGHALWPSLGLFVYVRVKLQVFVAVNIYTSISVVCVLSASNLSAAGLLRRLNTLFTNIAQLFEFYQINYTSMSVSIHVKMPLEVFMGALQGLNRLWAYFVDNAHQVMSIYILILITKI